MSQSTSANAAVQSGNITKCLIQSVREEGKEAEDDLENNMKKDHNEELSKIYLEQMKEIAKEFDHNNITDE